MSMMWERPNDGLAFEALLKLEDDREPITAATPAATYPCGASWPGKSADEKVRDLSKRLAQEIATAQRLRHVLDEVAHEAAKWRTRCYTRLGLASVAGAICGAVVATAVAWWAL